MHDASPNAMQENVENLQIILYPDPRLKAVSRPVLTSDGPLHAVAARMFQLMRQHGGVGLAAPQVGLNIRMFIMNHSGQPQDDRVYINPELTEAEGSEEGEEGCLSLPDIRSGILRSRTLRMQAADLDGRPIDQADAGYVARIWQHEFDHLNGVLILDRMGPVAKLRHRGAIRDLQEKWDIAHPKPAKSKARVAK